MTCAPEVLAALDYPMLVVTAAAAEERAASSGDWEGQLGFQAVRGLVPGHAA